MATLLFPSRTTQKDEYGRLLERGTLGRRKRRKRKKRKRSVRQARSRTPRTSPESALRFTWNGGGKGAKPRRLRARTASRERKKGKTSRSLNRCQRGWVQRDRIDGRPGDSPGRQTLRAARRAVRRRKKAGIHIEGSVSNGCQGATYHKARETPLNDASLKNALKLRKLIMNWHPTELDVNLCSFVLKQLGREFKLDVAKNN